MNNRALPIYGKGKNSREWIYVKDHCEALIKVFKKEKLENFIILVQIKTLNNLSSCERNFKNFKKKLKIGKNVKIKFVKDRPGHDIRYALNSNKIKKKLKLVSKNKFFTRNKN